MGATNIEHVFPDATPRADIIKAWNTAVDASLYEDGHSYSGCIGMFGHGIDTWHDKEFFTENEAGDFLLNTQQKWRPAHAVSFLRAGAKFWLIGGWVAE